MIDLAGDKRTIEFTYRNLPGPASQIQVWGKSLAGRGTLWDVPRLVRPVLLIALLGGACTGAGITIEVSPGSTGATRVELFVVDKPCDDCADGFTPPPRTADAQAEMLPGSTYLRNHGAPFAADIVDGEAVFALLPDGKDDTVGLVVAVGYGPGADEGENVVGYQVLASSMDTAANYVRLKATLEPPLDTFVSEQHPDVAGTRLQVWRQARDERAGCLAIERWDRDGSGKVVLVNDERIYIVPADDRDCDNHLPPDECDAYYPNAPNIGAGNICVATDVPDAPSDACLVGDAKECTGDRGGAMCVPRPGTCYPTPLCRSTTDDGCSGSTEDDCPRESIFKSRFIKMRCTVQLGTELGMQVPCPNAGPLPLQIALGTTACSGGFIEESAGLYGSPTATTTYNGITLHVVEDACKFSILADGVVIDPAQAPVLPVVLVKATLANGYTVVIPTQFQLQSNSAINCSNATGITCAPIDDPSLTNCAHGPQR